MIRRTHAVRGAAVIGVMALALAACGGSSNGGGSEEPTTDTNGGATEEPASEAGDSLVIGTLLPVTGNLAFLGPPEIAGVDLAVKEINEAGGVNGAEVRVEHADSGDAENIAVATQSVDDLLSKGVHAIIGAASSSVSLGVIDTITENEVVQVSPANTSAKFSGYSDFYFRTAPPDSVQGNALGNVIADDGHERVGILVFNDDYGTGLRDYLQQTLEERGVEVTYGKQGANEEFAPKQNNYEAEVTAITATNPDAIALISFEEAAVIIPQLVQAGFDTSNVYLVDGNTANYPDLDPGTLEGAKGTIPGANPSDEFRNRLMEVDPSLTEFSYAAESYDATMLVALAALKGGSNDSATIQANMAAVSGANGGTECSTFADCAALIEDGEEIIYAGQSGVGPFNDDNDPSSAFIGIYEYDGENSISWTQAVFGEIG